MHQETFWRLIKIAGEIDRLGQVPVSRLDLMRKWLSKPGRFRPFTVRVAGRAAGKKGKSTGEAGRLFSAAAAMLCNRYQEAMYRPQLDPAQVRSLIDGIHALQSDSGPPLPGAKGWNLALVAKALTLYLQPDTSAEEGCELAIAWCGASHPRHGFCLTGPSRTKLMDLASFVSTVEGYEELGL